MCNLLKIAFWCAFVTLPLGIVSAKTKAIWPIYIFIEYTQCAAQNT